jgi:cyclophilin family peptidyl-prolyl cis-trans isomerase
MTPRLAIGSLLLAGAMALTPAAPAAAPQAGAGPVLVIETPKGTIEIQLFPEDAPRSVEHILELARRNFYRGQRFHRVTSTLAQFGDPGTRDMSRIDYWGNGNSGRPIGVAEFSKRLTHVRGTVALANSGSPQSADSQLYIMKAASPSLNGKYVIVGRVTSGMEAVDKIAKTDRLINVTIRGAGPSE